MVYDRIVVKYGELTLKGKNKREFTDRLIKTIKEKCKHLDRLTFEKRHDRFYILLNGTDYHEVVQALNKVFGIHAYSLAAFTELDLDKVKELAVLLIKDQVKEPATFKVKTKRVNKNFPLGSMEITREVASYVLRHCKHLTVDVKNPQVTLSIEVRYEGVYLMLDDIPGLGGLPVGVDHSRGLLMISGGIDSPVAGYLMQKRGLVIDAIHFESPPYTSVQAKQKVIDLLEKLAVYHPNGKIRLFIVPFTKMQKAIYQHCPAKYGITIMRRMMYRISERVARRENDLVIINGESLGQVASQTLESMYVINEVTNLPVLRPLVAMDKLEIMKIAEKIGTYPISILPYEDCCTIFIPEHPVTKPDLEKVKEYEANFDFASLIEEAIANIELLIIDEQKKTNLLLDDSVANLF